MSPGRIQGAEMLLDQRTLRGIETGGITLAFRRWKRPTVRAGGTLLTSAGQLAIEAVEPISPEDITEADANAAGFGTRTALLDRLSERDGTLYRVRFGALSEDPRIALRERVPEGEDLDRILASLGRSDGRSDSGPWTHRYLDLIRRRPAERAADLAQDVDMARDDFKVRVRRLKALGLTESLKVGYRLSPRGTAVLTVLDAADAAESR